MVMHACIKKTVIRFLRKNFVCKNVGRVKSRTRLDNMWVNLMTLYEFGLERYLEKNCEVFTENYFYVISDRYYN